MGVRQGVGTTGGGAGGGEGLNGYVGGGDWGEEYNRISALNNKETVPNRTEDPHDPPSRVGAAKGVRGSVDRNTSSVTGGDSKGRYS